MPAAPWYQPTPGGSSGSSLRCSTNRQQARSPPRPRRAPRSRRRGAPRSRGPSSLPRVLPGVEEASATLAERSNGRRCSRSPGWRAPDAGAAHRRRHARVPVLGGGRPRGDAGAGQAANSTEVPDGRWDQPQVTACSSYPGWVGTDVGQARPSTSGSPSATTSSAPRTALDQVGAASVTPARVRAEATPAVPWEKSARRSGSRVRGDGGREVAHQPLVGRLGRGQHDVGRGRRVGPPGRERAE